MPVLDQSGCSSCLVSEECNVDQVQNVWSVSESFLGLLWSRGWLMGAALAGESEWAQKTSTSEGSWKESWSPLGVLSRRIAGNARMNFTCRWWSSVHTCWKRNSPQRSGSWPHLSWGIWTVWSFAGWWPCQSSLGILRWWNGGFCVLRRRFPFGVHAQPCRDHKGRGLLVCKETEVAPNLKAADFIALRDLNLLLQENVSLDGMWEEDFESEKSEEEVERNPIKKFKRKSHSFPPLNQNPALALFIRQITREIEDLRTDTIPHNLNLRSTHYNYRCLLSTCSWWLLTCESVFYILLIKIYFYVITLCKFFIHFRMVCEHPFVAPYWNTIHMPPRAIVEA